MTIEAHATPRQVEKVARETIEESYESNPSGKSRNSYEDFDSVDYSKRTRVAILQENTGVQATL